MHTHIIKKKSLTKKCNQIEKRNFLQLHSYSLVDETLIIFFYRLKGSCFDIENLEDNFPILTTDQVAELEDGKYTRTRSDSFDLDNRIKVDKLKTLIFDNYDEALKKRNELNEKSNHKK